MTNLREQLKKKLTKKEMSKLRASYDIIGDIAIIEIPYELEKKKKIIATTLLQTVKNIKTVACKKGAHIGKYRRQKLEIIAGEKKLITTHKESGCTFKLDLEKCYFSPRLGAERLRAAELIKPNETILVACSGIAPFPIIFAKHTKAKKINCIELNPIAHKFALENIKQNKTQNKIFAYKGDIKKINKIIKEKFDRIFLPAPKEGASLLQPLLKTAKKGAFLHVYDFAPEENLSEASEKIKKECEKARKKCKILQTVKCGQHSTRKFRVRTDMKIN